MTKKVKFSAPAKLILSGEHAVVYGYPAITTAINLRLTVYPTGKIVSELPIGNGVGSSAAFAVATSAAKLGKIDLPKINEMAYEIEKKLHGKPSGVDNTVVTYGGFLWYRKENENFKMFQSIGIKRKLPKIFLINSGKPVESTREMVEMVGKRYQSKKSNTEKIFRNIEVVTKNLLDMLLGGNEDFGKLITSNERLLEELGVVSDKTKKLIKIIENCGGHGKISGAGGRKEGSGMVIVYHKDIEKLNSIGKKIGLNLIPVKLGEEGVRIEK